MTQRQIDNRVKKLADLEEQKKALEEQISSLKAEIQDEMKETETLETANYIIRWTSVTSERFDSKSFKNEHAELFSKFVKQTESRRFSFVAK